MQDLLIASITRNDELYPHGYTQLEMILYAIGSTENVDKFVKDFYTDRGKTKEL